MDAVGLVSDRPKNIVRPLLSAAPRAGDRLTAVARTGAGHYDRRVPRGLVAAADAFR